MTEEELFADLAERLRLLHLRLVSTAMPESEKSRITRRFRAITDASKQDLERAAKRLDALEAELDARHSAG